MNIIPHADHSPQIDADAFVFPGSFIIGQVTLENAVSIWYNCVIRADINGIRIGPGTNIQDGTVIHVDHNFPVNIGANVTVGHGCIIHGCDIASNSLIGMGATLLNGCRIGEGAIVAAGSLVKENFIVEPGTLVAGVPARRVREVRDDEYKAILNSAIHYRENAAFQHPGTIHKRG